MESTRPIGGPDPFAKLRDAAQSFVPGTKGALYDAIFLMIIYWIQSSVLSFSGPLPISADLVTPAVTLLAVHQRLEIAIFSAFFAGFLVEAATSVPSGFYISTYLSLVVTMHFVRPHISWRIDSSWNYIFCIAQFYVVALLALTLFLLNTPKEYFLNLLILFCGQIGLSSILPRFFPEKWKNPQNSELSVV